jgi:hypothetical protein
MTDAPVQAGQSGLSLLDAVTNVLVVFLLALLTQIAVFAVLELKAAVRHTDPRRGLHRGVATSRA